MKCSTSVTFKNLNVTLGEHNLGKCYNGKKYLKTKFTVKNNELD
jgi:hypothetical protein